MNDERGDAPKDEGAQGQAAPKSKEKRVAPYFYPNVLLAVPAAILSKSEGFFEPVFLIFAAPAIVGIIFAIGSLFADADGDGKKAARRARAARVLFWVNFLVLTVPLILPILQQLICELHDRFGLF